MMPQCCFDSLALPLVVDTSVAINLNATGCASALISAIPNHFVMTTHVRDELNGGMCEGRNDAELNAQLVDGGLVEITHLGEEGVLLFEQLVSGDAVETLHDGEAATIALAIELGGIAVIDERKATRICAEQFPKLWRASTVDLFAHPDVLVTFGHGALADAVFGALQGARMNVQAHHLQWVVGLIGPERVVDCCSLPRRVRASTRTCGELS